MERVSGGGGRGIGDSGDVDRQAVPGGGGGGGMKPWFHTRGGGGASPVDWRLQPPRTSDPQLKARPPQYSPGLLLSRGGGGGRGFWTQNLVYQKWPDQIFPIVNFIFSRDGHFGLGGRGGGFGGGPPLWFLILLKKPSYSPTGGTEVPASL